MTNEQILDACSMRINGYTLQEIADKFGVSKEYIHSITPHVASGYTKRTVSVYPAINNWMRNNHYSYNMMAKELNVSYGSIRNWMRGETKITKNNIDKILFLTGMEYEEAFAMDSCKEDDSL